MLLAPTGEILFAKLKERSEASRQNIESFDFREILASHRYLCKIIVGN